MPNYIGIDFGTTRSTVAIFDSNSTEHRVKKNGKPELSIAAIDKTTGECHYGARAQEKIGEKYDFIPSLKDLLHKGYNKQYGGVNVTRESILAGFFKYLKSSINNANTSEIVLAIPNEFPVERRCILRSAAKAAGFDVKFFINEPTAAFFANYSNLSDYGNNTAILRNCESVAIFDWGGGTLDVTVMQCANGMVKELAKKCMNSAGNAIDERVAQCVHHWISERKGKNKSFEDMTMNAQLQMRQFVEEAKINLNGLGASCTEEEINIGNYDDYGSVIQTITKEMFNSSIEYIVDAAINVLRETIDESKLGIGGIDKILLVGGSSKLHLLQEKMKAEFGDKLLISSGDSDWGVAIGAALLSVTPGDFIVNQDVSLRLSDDSSFPLIKKDSLISEYSYGKKTPLEFGKVDSDSIATFVFSGPADIDNSETKYLLVKTQALFDEKIILEVYIDENMIVHVDGHCSGLPDEKSYWTYANLAYCYKLPQA